MKRRSKNNGRKKIIFAILIIISIFLFVYQNNYFQNSSFGYSGKESYTISDIPSYFGEDYVILNENNPSFDNLDITNSFESYSELDSLGRCGTAIANIGIDLMPEGERESISSITPSGWHSIKYDIISGKYLYNRCHLIGYQLTGEGANERNLITCTRHMNVEGMLEFENEVKEYIDKTHNHVLYRVTPIFENDNLVVKGVQMEAYSIEDGGAGIKFNVFVYNVQKNILIDYKTGNSQLVYN